MDAETIIRISLSLIFVCSLAAMFIIFVLPKYCKTDKALENLFKIKSKIKLDPDHSILIVQNKDFESLVFMSTKHQANLIGTLDSQDKFSPLI